MAQAILYCDRCGKIIPPSALQGQDAMILEGGAMCPTCAKSLPAKETARLLRKRKTPSPGQKERHSSRTHMTPGHVSAAQNAKKMPVMLAVGITTGIAVGVTIGLVVALSRQSPEQLPAMPLPDPMSSPRTAAISTSAVDPTNGALDQELPDTLSPARAQLEQIRSLVDLELKRYVEIRSRIHEFVSRNPASPEADDAKSILEDVDRLYATRAEAALKAARAEADLLLESSKYAEAVAAVQASGERHAEGDWLTQRGRALVAAQLDELAKAWSASIASALSRSQEALDAGTLVEARDFLSASPKWPEKSRRHADEILKQIDKREASAMRESQRDEIWLRFLSAHVRASRDSVARAAEQLERERDRLSELRLDEPVLRIEQRLRDAKLVESLAIDSLSADRGTVRVHVGERRVTGKVLRLEKRVLTLKPIVGSEVDVPLDEMWPDEIAGAAGLLRGGAADPIRAASYCLARGRFDLSRAHLTDIADRAADDLREDITQIETAIALTCRLELAWAAPQRSETRGTPVAGMLGDFEDGLDGFDLTERKPTGFDAASVTRQADPHDPGQRQPLRLGSGRAALKVSYSRAGVATGRLSIEKRVAGADWRAWRVLKANVYVPAVAGTCFGGLAINTREGNWQDAPTFLLQPGWNLLWQEMAAVKGTESVSGLRLSLSPKRSRGEQFVYVDAIELSHASPGELTSGSLMSATLEDFESERVLTVFDSELSGCAFAREAAPSPRGVSGRISWRLKAPERIELHYGGAGPALPGTQRGGNAMITFMLQSPAAASIENVAVWMQDAQGELFEWRTSAALAPAAWGRVNIELVPSALTGSWGPKRNMRVDPPVRLAGLSIALKDGAPPSGEVFIDDIAYAPLEKETVPANLRPAPLGEIFRTNGDHPNGFPTLDFQTYVKAEGFTRIAAGKGAHGSRALHTATLTSGVDGRALLPGWLDPVRSLPESQVRTILPFDRYMMKWGPGGGLFTPVHGVAGAGKKSESFDLTLMPRATLGGAKIGIGMWRTHTVRSSEVIINRVTIGEGAGSRAYEFDIHVDLTPFQWSALAAHSVYVPVLEGTPITFNFTVSFDGYDPVTGVGVWFMFTE